MTYFTREEWGARPYLTGGNKVTHGPMGVAIHYNGLPLNIGPVCECDKLVRGIQNYHMDTKGWKDIAYDVVACPHGNTYQGRIGTTNGTGANGTDESNANYMAVMGLIGDGETPTPQLYEAIKSGIKICQAVGAGDIVTGHREFAATPCPGTALWTWILSGLTGDDATVSEKLVSRLAYGSKGAEVTLLQTMLNGLIEAGLTVDGSFGTATENKVKEYQTTYGFDADGIVGPITRGQLNTDWAEHNAYEPPGNVGEEPKAGMPIMGKAKGPVEAYQEAAKTTRANDLFIYAMLPAIYEAAVAYGIDPAVMIGQSGHETGWGNFGRAVTPEHHNTCGLKVRNPVGPDDNPDDHATFDSWEEGATAHAQHLYAYMGTELPEGVENIDPRWDWVFGKHQATVVEDLSGKWAPAGTYGDSVVSAANVFANVADFVPVEPPVEEPPIEEPVEPELPIEEPVEPPVEEPPIEEPPVEEPVEPPIEEPPVEEPVEEPKVADLTVAELEALLEGLAFKVAHEVWDIFKQRFSL